MHQQSVQAIEMNRDEWRRSMIASLACDLLGASLQNKNIDPLNVDARRLVFQMLAIAEEMFNQLDQKFRAEQDEGDAEEPRAAASH